MGFRYFPDTNATPQASDYLSARFGGLDADECIQLMKYEVRDETLLFSTAEAPAVSRLEPSSREWTDTNGVKRTARWWQESVRCEAKSGVKEGDQLVISFFPWSALHCDVATFHQIPNPSRAMAAPESVVGDERSTYRDEQEFLRSLDQRIDSRLGSPGQLVATVRRPHSFQSLFQRTERQPRAKDTPRLVYGLVQTPYTVQAFSDLLLRSGQLAETLRLAAIGSLTIAHPSAKSTVFLHAETKDIVKTLIALVSRMVLAGPAADPEVWYGKPVESFVDQTFRGLTNNANRRNVDASKRLQAGNTSDAAISDKSTKSQNKGSKHAIPDEEAALLTTIRAHKSELALLEKRLQQIEEQIAEYQLIIGQS